MSCIRWQEKQIITLLCCLEVPYGTNAYTIKHMDSLHALENLPRLEHSSTLSNSSE